MQLYDKDLLSVQEVRDLVEKAKKAQQEFAQKSQEEVDAIVKSVAEAGVRNAKRLAKMAHEETGFGIEADKVIKNVFGSRGVYEAIKDMKTIGVLEVDEEKKTKKIAIPVGIVAGLIPSTNPTSTAFYKSEIALKGGNAIIFSPHPNAKNCIVEAVKVIRTAIAEAGGNEDLVSVITIPTIQATDMLMKHPDVATILATGGSAMVRAAYSSGTPAIGVGPGNGPAYIEKTADVALAVKRIIDSKTFDNGTICASEQSVMCDCDMEPAVRVEMEKQGAYFLNNEQIAKLGKFILRANGTMNPQIVGKSAQVIADLAEIEIPEGTRVLVAKETGIGFGHPYSNEKLAPILGFYTAENYVEICELAQKILHYEGAGHTFSMHTKDPKIVDYFAARIPASRIMVNTPSALGGIGASTGMLPALTLGCGAIGGSATSENVGPQHLINVRVVAEGLLEMDEIRKNTEALIAAPCCTVSKAADIDVDMLVNEIVKRLQAI
ncbi:MAG: acetaldehyde dehydrogenase (acetylating) [Clostridiaceae bacterium]|nr:acetaldehyde dehydrogenase (acetylating) [Clostridiaceae bacterium]MDD5797521.1 acetaldehyde dehydrogenase (acetylating) [Clostridiaceae bacterium]MDY4546738.1 acetaldehyde dehydrogenase (acetylating) [Candidatus Choladocola sp.]